MSSSSQKQDLGKKTLIGKRKECSTEDYQTVRNTAEGACRPPAPQDSLLGFIGRATPPAVAASNEQGREGEEQELQVQQRR